MWVEYRAGNNHGNADGLSRRPPTEQVMTITQHLTKDLGDLQAAQLKGSLLEPIITALSNTDPISNTVPPGLEHVFLKDGILCRNFRQTSSSTGTTQLVLPISLHKIVLE